jgi:hypothetical protein
MVEDPADDLLRDVTVDQPGAQGVTPLMRREMHSVAVFVADVAGIEPALQGHPIGRGADRVVPVDVLGGAGEQDPCTARPVIGVAAPLMADGVGEFGVDGDQGVAVHLVVEVAQIGGAVGVGGDAVAAQPQRVGDT